MVLLWKHWQGVPRTLGVLQPLIFLVLVGLSRAMARFWLAGIPMLGSGHSGNLLVYGAGTAGVQTASALQVSGQFKLVGFVDDDAAMVGRSINGLPIFAADDILALVPQHKITDILIAMPSATRERRNKIIQSLEALPVHVRSLPSMADLTSGKVTVQDFRELDIEDLLGRVPVPPRADLVAHDLAGQVVLVSGAGGSIGSELTRQIVEQKPRQLLLLTTTNLASIRSTRSYRRCVKAWAMLWNWCLCWPVFPTPSACRPYLTATARPRFTTRRPTSMFPWWRTTRARACATMCLAPCTWRRRQSRRACTALC
jgi:FlaA1/EpsC-like NDP-sugar epimerase